MSTIREQQIGLLEVIGYLMAIIAVVGAVAWGWYLILVLALIVAAVPYAIWWEIRNLEPRNDPSRRACRTIAKEGSVSQAQASGRPVATETEHNGNNRVYPPGIQTTGAIKLKGIPHESVECSKA